MMGIIIKIAQDQQSEATALSRYNGIHIELIDYIYNSQLTKLVQ